MPSGTLESPLSTSQARALIKSSTLRQDAEKTCFRNSYASDSVAQTRHPIIFTAPIMVRSCDQQLKITISQENITAIEKGSAYFVKVSDHVTSTQLGCTAYTNNYSMFIMTLCDRLLFLWMDLKEITDCLTSSMARWSTLYSVPSWASFIYLSSLQAQ